MINEIRSFISQCPCFSGRLININHLGSKVGSVSLENAPSTPRIKEYTDGERICRTQFILATRESFSQSLSSNCAASEFFESFSAWLIAQNHLGNLPGLEGNLTPVSILPDGSHTMKSSSGTTARYEITLELCYHESPV